MCPSSTSNSKAAEDRTLVALPPEASSGSGPGGLRRLVVWCLLLVNGAILLGTLGIDLVYPAQRPEAVGVEKTQDDERRANAKWSDGSKASLIESDYRQTSRVRRKLSKPYTEWLFRMFGEGGPGVLVGKEGMLFLRDRVEVPETHFRVGAQRTGAIYAAVSRRLEALGIRMVLAPVPRKSVVCQDWLPLGWQPNRQYDEIVLEEFQRRGVFTADLLSALEPHAGESFLRMDTHWSTQGMRHSAKAVGEMTGWIKPEGERYGAIREVPAPTMAPLGDLTLMMGIDLKESDAPKYQRPMLEVVLPNGQSLPQGDIQANIVLCGTSFSQHGTFGSFLAHFLGLSVQTYSIPGAPPYAALATMFQERMPDRLPHIVIEEVPNHHVISAGHQADRWAVNHFAAEVFSKYRPQQVFTLPLPAEAFRTSAPMGTPLDAVGGRVLLDIDEGWVAHSGGGVVELYLEGDVIEGQVRMDIYHGSGTLSAPWPAEGNSLQLPLLNQTEGSPAVQVVLATLTPEARFNLRKAEIRVVGVEAQGTPGTVQGADASASSSLAEGEALLRLDFEEGVMLPAHGALVIETKKGADPAQNVRISLPSEDQQPDFVYPLGMVRAGGVIALDLGAHYGRTMTELEVRAVGASADWIQSVRMVPIR